MTFLHMKMTESTQTLTFYCLMATMTMKRVPRMWRRTSLRSLKFPTKFPETMTLCLKVTMMKMMY